MAATSCSMTTTLLQKEYPAIDCRSHKSASQRSLSQAPAGLAAFRGPKSMGQRLEHQVGTFYVRSSSVSTQSMQPPSSFGGRPSGSKNSPVVAGAVTNPVASFLSRFTNSDEKRRKLKEELLDAIAGLDRGAAASEEEKAEVDRLASQLEAITPIPKSLSSPLLNGKWKLLYTTSASILGTQRPKALRPNGPIFQYIDAEKLRAKNVETFPFFNQVTANLTPESASNVRVQFDTFKIFGLIPVKAPPSARGFLDVTYVDDDLRISRGDKGNLFILQQEDNSARL